MIDVYCVSRPSTPSREDQLQESLLEQPPTFARGYHSLRVLWIQLQGFLGPGVLLVPFAVRRTNLLLGVAALLGVYLIYSYSFSVLARCAEYTQTYVYAELPYRVGARRNDILPLYHPDSRDSSFLGHWLAILVNLTRFFWATGVGAVAILYVSGSVATVSSANPLLIIAVVCLGALCVLNFSVSHARMKKLNVIANTAMVVGFAGAAALTIWCAWKRETQPAHAVAQASNVAGLVVHDSPWASLTQHLAGLEGDVAGYWQAICVELRHLLAVVTEDLKVTIVNLGVVFLALDAVYQLLPTKALLSEPNQFRAVAFTAHTAVVVLCLVGTAMLPGEAWLAVPARKWRSNRSLSDSWWAPMDYKRWRACVKGCFVLAVLCKLPLIIAPAADLLVTNQLSSMQVSRRLSSGSHTLIINDEIQDVVTSRSSNQHGQRCAGCRQYHQRICQFARGCELLAIACVIGFTQLSAVELAAAVGLFCSVPLVVIYPALLRLALRPDGFRPGAEAHYGPWNPALYLPPVLLDLLVAAGAITLLTATALFLARDLRPFSAAPGP